MSRTPWFLVRRNLGEHWFRSLLTVGSLAAAVFLFCMLRSVITSLESTVEEASADRVIVQSSVSLFVSLPQDYQAKIAAVPGVEEVSKFNWFGGYFREPKNMFAQFAIDHVIFFKMYDSDMELMAGHDAGPETAAAVIQAFKADRRAAIVGADLAKEFDWKVGDTVPIIPTIYRKQDGSEWEFNIVGFYQPKRSSVDRRTMFFRFDYLDETLRPEQGPVDVGTFSVNTQPGYPASQVISDIDALFVNGPQSTKTSTEAAFQATFVSMMGNLPFFFGTIGGAVLIAVLFSVINTMYIAGRQRVHDAGILQALGYRGTVMVRLLLAEALLLTILGGGLGIGLSVLAAVGAKAVLASFLPNFVIMPDTLMWAAVISLGIGVLAGIGPGWMASRYEPTAALRSS
ncbi:MAG: ABC transporter permease [Planctomycetota bacterium]